MKFNRIVLVFLLSFISLVASVVLWISREERMRDSPYSLAIEYLSPRSTFSNSDVEQRYSEMFSRIPFSTFQAEKFIQLFNENLYRVSQWRSMESEVAGGSKE